MSRAPESTPAWAALARHAEAMRGRHLRDLFASDPGRVESLTLDVGDWRVDFSKNLVTAETIDLLVDLADAVGIGRAARAMWSGERINVTEDRPVLHPALRAAAGDRFAVDGRDVVADVLAVRRRLSAFVDAVRDGRRRGHRGDAFRTVVNIGIGGSDLGPAMATRALSVDGDGPDVRFVSNVDPRHLAHALGDADPASTLFVVVSKTFTTAETMANAGRARDWIIDALGPDAVGSHFVAASSAVERAAEFGLDPDAVFEFWDWVGGRYSVWSAVGLSLMLAVGSDRFEEFLAGGRDTDLHWIGSGPRDNAPLLAALIGVWNRNFLGAASHCVVPYAQRLERFPAFLQQLDMESNGKRVHVDGSPVGVDSGPVVWGEPGTNGQHAFFQLLHQGTSIVPVDFVGTATPEPGLDEAAHRVLVGNMLAQSAALAFGRSAEEAAAGGSPPQLVAHRTFPGDRPSTTFLAPSLTARSLGQLVAFYEHRTFAQGAVWGINSFDQWGVELGKDLAGPIIEALATGSAGAHDPSTAALVASVRSMSERAGGAG